jgi:lipopolysaccharide/colanic/teichoic acid biosynthesis glycosyltransferase
VEEQGSLRYIVRRAINITVAVLAILITAPIMLVVAVLVKLTSRGPVIFTQPRVGLDRRARPGGAEVDRRRKQDLGGRIFQIYKFRTMTHCAEANREQRWATPDDPRVTPVGRVLRKYRLDELPQFFNVLKGDMNIVGPRPEQPEIFQELREQVDGYERRQRVLPGITGRAQVNHHYDRCIKDVRIKVQHDLEYVRQVSPLEDMRIMARTLPVILFRKGGW